MDLNVTHLVSEGIRRFGYMFYLMNPHDHVYQKVEDVKIYVNEVFFLTFAALLIEQVLLRCQKKPAEPLHEIFASTGNASFYLLGKILGRSLKIYVYSWIYNNYRIIDLPWDSPLVWILGALTADFVFYWTHRWSHQINIIWAFHETHHSSEHLTFLAGSRVHIFQFLFYWLIPNPFALLIPPTVQLVHQELHVVVQFWVHTELIHKFPAPIEFFFNTPSNHRVHHGRNRKYIDKNFGSFLIIWDRMFGTYEAEDPSEKVVYGITTPHTSVNPLVTQAKPFYLIWKKLAMQRSLANKLSAIFKGPGWSPGKPWTGDLQDVPHPPPKFERFQPSLSLLTICYVFIHYLTISNEVLLVVFYHQVLPTNVELATVFYLLYSIGCIGFIFDQSSYVPALEVIRCSLYFLVDITVFPIVQEHGSIFEINMHVNRVLFALSLLAWISIVVKDSYARMTMEIDKRKDLISGILYRKKSI